MSNKLIGKGYKTILGVSRQNKVGTDEVIRKSMRVALFHYRKNAISQIEMVRLYNDKRSPDSAVGDE